MKRHCPKCGFELTENMRKFCGKCGAIVTEVSEPAKSAEAAPPLRVMNKNPEKPPEENHRKKTIIKAVVGVVILATLITIGALVYDIMRTGPSVYFGDLFGWATPRPEIPSIETPTEPYNPTVPENSPASAPASTPVQPDLSNYRRTVTLGDCNLYHLEFPDNMRGWTSINPYGIPSSWEISDFTGSRYLIIELETAPKGGLVIALNGDGTGYSWAESQLAPDSGSDQTVFIVDLTKINGYDNFIASNEVAEIWLHYWSNNWSDLPVKDVYFATDA